MAFVENPFPEMVRSDAPANEVVRGEPVRALFDTVITFDVVCLPTPMDVYKNTWYEPNGTFVKEAVTVEPLTNGAASMKFT